MRDETTDRERLKMIYENDPVRRREALQSLAKAEQEIRDEEPDIEEMV